MNEKLQYATMLEMPFSTADVTVKPSKRKKKKAKPVDTEAVKQELIEKVNSQPIEQDMSLDEQLVEDQLIVDEQLEQTASVKPLSKKPKQGSFKISVIAVQFVVIGALIATIFLTSALNTNSGINVFFKSIFGTETQTVDQRLHQDFKPVIAMGEEDYVMENGVITINSTGSVYSSCDGKILSITNGDDGKFSVEIEYSQNFKSIISGLDYVYGQEGSEVYSKIPVGYSIESGATMCFTGADGSIISGYQIIDNSVVWSV